MDVRTIVTIASFVLNIILLIGGWYVFTKIRFNDLKHLETDVKIIIKNQGEDRKKLDSIKSTVDKITATCAERGKFLDYLSK